MTHSTFPNPHLRVMTFNTANDFIQPMHLLAMLRDSRADIISLVELSPNNADALTNQLEAEYPYRQLFGKPFDGKGILSRYPIEGHEFFTLLTARPHIEAQINVQGHLITVFVVHAPAPNYRKFEVQSPHSVGEIKMLLERGHLDEPTIYMGDFNLIEGSPAYRLLKKAGLTDTFHACGSGSGLTFPTRFQYMPVRLPLMLRIDYVWVTKHFQPLSCQVAAGYGSDHLPVISELELLSHIRPGRQQ